MTMEAPKRKVTAKLSSQNINGSSTNPSSSLPISPSPHIVVRAKISSTARARTNYSDPPTPGNANGSTNSSINGALRPQVGATARRSPSPAKMRSVSPSKLQPSPRPATVRAPPSKVAAVKPHTDRTRQSSISSMLSFTPPGTSSATASTPATPLALADTNNNVDGDSIPYLNIDSGSGSFRIKAKVSGLAKPAAPPSLSTVLSPPSSSPSVAPSFPTPNRPPRLRATTVASRRPSVSFSVSKPQASQSLIQPAVSHEPPQLVPLPTSPPASALSFSSHSSTSASASNAQSHSTSTGLTSPSSCTNHARSESLPLSMLNIRPPSDPSSSRDDPSGTNPPPGRTLVARVRPETRISGGSGRGWTSGSSVAGERDLGSSAGARTAEMDDQSTDDSDRSVDEPRKRREFSGTDDGPEDVRAEAKSNRKIADLEITTRSLLAINAALEASKVRQAREVRELRRKLRETRLAMPPGRFRLLTEKERGDNGDGDLEDDESDDGDEGETGEGDGYDEGFKRVKTLVEDLLTAGRRALAVPAPPSFLNQSAPSLLTAAPGTRLGLGIDPGPLGGTRMDQGEVLGWDVGSSLGTNAGAGVGSKSSGSRRWKHGVAIGSKVLSPEEAKPWVGEEGEKEGEEEDQMEVDMIEDGRKPNRAMSPSPDETSAGPCHDFEQRDIADDVPA